MKGVDYLYYTHETQHPDGFPSCLSNLFDRLGFICTYFRVL